MKMFTPKIISCVLFTLVTFTIPAEQTQPPEKNYFEYCLKSGKGGSFMSCAGMAALNKLQTIQEEEKFNLIDGVTFVKDESTPRGFGNFMDRDPNDYSGIFNSFGSLLSERSLNWDMGRFYPGLYMRVNPNLNVNGVLEFALDPARAASYESFKDGSSGTARLITRQLLVPFLLGTKFKIASLVPIFFGLIAILTQKAFGISKIAFIISAVYGLGNLIFGSESGFNGPGAFGGFGGFGTGGYGHPAFSSSSSAFPTYAPIHYKPHLGGHRPHYHRPHYSIKDHELTDDNLAYTSGIFRDQNESEPLESADSLSFKSPPDDIFPKAGDQARTNSGRNFSWEKNATKHGTKWPE